MAARLRRTLAGAWRALDFTRRALLNLLLLALLVGVAWLLLRPGAPALQDKTVLVLELQGEIREQRSGSWREQATKRVRGGSPQQMQLRDLLTGLEAAALDPAITRLLLLTDGLAGAGPATLREVGAAIDRFRAAGKPVTAWGANYGQAAYGLAAHADEVLVHPMGQVLIEGYGRHRNYYREAFDRFGITPHVLRVGSYKNAGETWVAAEPSTETLEADRTLLDALWRLYTDEVEGLRKLPAGAIGRMIDELPERFSAAGGDAAALAKKEGLVDGSKTRDELRALMIERGVADPKHKSFRQVHFNDYLARVKPATASDQVAVIVAEGGIRDGKAPPGAIGGESTAALIRQAREDDKVKALVLRVDSPGGSAFGAELVRRELELTRAAGKPVVVSMGDLAASGGYWISLAADEIIADASTITGSIGVVAMFPGIEQAMAKLGVHTGGYTTTWLAGAFDPRRPLDPRLRQLIQTSIEQVYRDFTGKAAAARQQTPAQIDAVGQGRVWTGAQALERGLVDRLGRFDEAVASAAQRAKLADGQWRLVYVEASRGRLDRWLGRLMPSLQALGLDEALGDAGAPDLWRRFTGIAQAEDLLEFLRSADGAPPGAALAHCLCGAP